MSMLHCYISFSAARGDFHYEDLGSQAIYSTKNTK